MRLFTLTMFLACLLAGCAGPNPNIGERTSDYAWLSGRYQDAFNTVKPHAEAGEPWAQLRLAMFYAQGWGTELNMPLAVQWYEKAAAQKAEDNWAEGQMIGATGRTGFFNQNSDARIAQLKLATIYLEGRGVEKNLLKAYLNIRDVIEETKGRHLFFCCEFLPGGRFFTAQEIANTYQAVLKEMSPEQISEAENRYLQQKKK